MDRDRRIGWWCGGLLAGVAVGLYLRPRPAAESGRTGTHAPAVGQSPTEDRGAQGCTCRIAAPEPRNARRSRWRCPVDEQHKFLPWVHELRGKNGVYLIRDATTKELLYVGESHRERLMHTLMRHLWVWNGRGSGPTYSPRFVEIAVELYERPDEAIDRQFELIRQLDPRDNVVDGHTLPSLDEVPF